MDLKQLSWGADWLGIHQSDHYDIWRWRCLDEPLKWSSGQMLLAVGMHGSGRRKHWCAFQKAGINFQDNGQKKLQNRPDYRICGPNFNKITKDIIHPKVARVLQINVGRHESRAQLESQHLHVIFIPIKMAWQDWRKGKQSFRRHDRTCPHLCNE